MPSTLRVLSIFSNSFSLSLSLSCARTCSEENCQEPGVSPLDITSASPFLRPSWARREEISISSVSWAVIGSGRLSVGNVKLNLKKFRQSLSIGKGCPVGPCCVAGFSFGSQSQSVSPLLRAEEVLPLPPNPHHSTVLPDCLSKG